MKTRHLFVIIIFLVSFIHSNALTPDIKQVVVYRQGARITQTAAVTLSQGNSEVVLDNLTPSINPNSLQVAVRGNAILLSASVRTNFMGYKTLPARIKQMEDSLRLLNDRIDWIGNEQAIFQGEEKLILDNQKIVNEKEKITATDLTQLADFYRTRLTSLRKKVYDNNIELRGLRETKGRIEQQLQEIDYQKGKQMGEVVLNFSAEVAAKILVTISYITTNAGWLPIYDLRCAGTNAPIELLYKASVFQNSGYDWTGVDLVISTGNPTVSNERPILNPWYIDFLQPYIDYGASKRRAEVAPSAAMNMYIEAEEISDIEFKEAPAIPYEVTETSNQMAVEYDIKIKQDIPTDGKTHIVPISSFDLPAQYTYHTVPKLDQHAFLLAKVGNYNQYNLLPGQTNIFFEGMYVGQTYLNPEVTSDSLVVSMGRDDRISIKREVMKDYTSSKVIGTNKRVTKGYEMILRNNMTIPVSIEILDQVPVSQNKEIEVTVEEMGTAEYNQDYGRVLWKYDLAPGETKKFRFVFSVKFPKDKQVNGI